MKLKETHPIFFSMLKAYDNLIDILRKIQSSLSYYIQARASMSYAWQGKSVF